jgi:hypothetical protein
VNKIPIVPGVTANIAERVLTEGCPVWLYENRHA